MRWARRIMALGAAGASVISTAITGRCSLDRYAPRCGDFVLVVIRIAVLAARSAAGDTANQPRVRPGYQGRSPWLDGSCRRPAAAGDDRDRSVTTVHVAEGP